MLIDTDILIWYLRGHVPAAKFLHDTSGIAASAVTYMELVQGMRSKSELRTLQRQLREWELPIHPISESISDRASFLVEQHFLSHSLQLADALIAGTALEHGLKLATGNVKHFEAIDQLDIVEFHP